MGVKSPTDIHHSLVQSCHCYFLKTEQIRSWHPLLLKKFKTEEDNVQIDSLDFDPDIDRPDTQQVYHTTVVVSVHELLTSPDPESVDASNTQEEITDRDWHDTGHSTTEDSHRSCNLPQQVSDHLPADTPTGPQQATTTEHNTFDEIPQLEEEEDWENGQFADADTKLINRHNTHSESQQIQKEYTEHLLDLTDNQYYSEEYPSVQLQYSILDTEYYGPQPRRSHTHTDSCDPAGYYTPPPDPADVQHWHTHGRGKCAHLHLFGEKTCSAESRKARKW